MKNPIRWGSLSIYLFQLFIIIIVPFYLGTKFFPDTFNSFYSTLGGLGIWLCQIKMTNKSIHGHEKKCGWAISALADIAMIFLFLFGMLFILLSVLKQHLTSEMLPIIDNLLILLAALFAIGVYNTFYLDCSYEVKRDRLIIIDGKLLSPGEQYVLWPLFRYESCYLYRSVVYPIEKTKIRFKDGDLVLNLIVTVLLDFEAIAQSPITDFDYLAYNEELKRAIVRAVAFQARDQTCGQFLADKIKTAKVSVTGLPVIIGSVPESQLVYIS